VDSSPRQANQEQAVRLRRAVPQEVVASWTWRTWHVILIARQMCREPSRSRSSTRTGPSATASMVTRSAGRRSPWSWTSTHVASDRSAIRRQLDDVAPILEAVGQLRVAEVPSIESDALRSSCPFWRRSLPSHSSRGISTPDSEPAHQVYRRLLARAYDTGQAGHSAGPASASGGSTPISLRMLATLRSRPTPTSVTCGMPNPPNTTLG